MISFLLIIFFSYIIGSIPSAYIIAKLTKNIDIREYGSGNVGATNVIRVVGKFQGIFVLLIDFLKGFISVYFISNLHLNETWIVGDVGADVLRSGAALFVILGHVYTIFLGFKGGKGVATGAGAFIALSPYSALCSIVLFLVSLSITKVVSISSIIASFFLPIFLLLGKAPYQFIIIGFLASAIIIVKHIPNMKRLLEEKESKII